MNPPSEPENPNSPAIPSSNSPSFWKNPPPGCVTVSEPVPEMFVYVCTTAWDVPDTAKRAVAATAPANRFVRLRISILRSSGLGWTASAVAGCLLSFSCGLRVGRGGRRFDLPIRQSTRVILRVCTAYNECDRRAARAPVARVTSTAWGWHVVSSAEPPPSQASEMGSGTWLKMS